MSATVQFVKRLYDVSVKDLVITGVFVFALACSIALGVASRQSSRATANNTAVAQTTAEESSTEDPAEETPGAPFPTEPVDPAEEEAPTPPPAPAPAPTPQPHILAASIPNTGPGETAAALFAGTTIAGYAAYAWHLRRKLAQ